MRRLLIDFGSNTKNPNRHLEMKAAAKAAAVAAQAAAVPLIEQK